MITPELRAEMRRLVLREGWRIGTVARRFGVKGSSDLDVSVRRLFVGVSEGGHVRRDKVRRASG